MDGLLGRLVQPEEHTTPCKVLRDDAMSELRRKYGQADGKRHDGDARLDPQTDSPSLAKSYPLMQF